MIVEYIDAHRDEFGVDPLGRVLSEQAGVQIAPSSYYAAKAQGPVSPADLGDADDANTLFDLRVANRRLDGVRTLWHAARRADHDWGRDRVARLMRLTGIDGTVRGRRRTTTTERDKGAPPRYPDLIKRAWSTPRRRIGGGLLISRMPGRCKGSVTPHSVWMCSRGASWGGGSWPARRPRW